MRQNIKNIQTSLPFSQFKWIRVISKQTLTIRDTRFVIQMTSLDFETNVHEQSRTHSIHGKKNCTPTSVQIGLT